MVIHLKIIGILLIGLALVHLVFPKYFNWSKEFETMSLINRQMMYAHAFFIGLTLFLMGVFCYLFSEEIITTQLGKIIALGFGIFWFVRLIFQFFVYSKKLWWSKRFETSVHVVFAVLWSYFTIVFFIVFIGETSNLL